MMYEVTLVGGIPEEDLKNAMAQYVKPIIISALDSGSVTTIRLVGVTFNTVDEEMEAILDWYYQTYDME